MTIQITHGEYWSFFPLYRNIKKIIPNIPPKFRKLIHEKWSKFAKDLMEKGKFLEFTFGIDKETGISAIAIVHPKDNFSRKIGCNIVKGRILRQIGNYKYRHRYLPLPDYINVEGE